MLRVGMPPLTLRVTDLTGSTRCFFVGPASAGKPLISIVPTLCVGMHPLTLRVTGLAGSTRCFLVGPALAGKRPVAAPPMLRCNACFDRSHALRGNASLTLRVTGLTGLAGSTRCFFVGLALAGKRPVAAPPMLRCNACFPSKLHHSYLQRIFQKCHQCLHPRAAQFARGYEEVDGGAVEVPVGEDADEVATGDGVADVPLRT